MVKILVNAVVMKDDKVLVAFRSPREKHAGGFWCMPGGRMIPELEFGILEKTAQREVLEETGIKIKPEMHLLTNHIFQHDEDGECILAVVFLCEYESGEIKVDDIEIVFAEWIEEKELDKLFFNHPNVKDYAKKGFQIVKQKGVSNG